MAVIENLIADTFGTHIGKYSERLKVTQAQETLVQVPLLHLKSVLITSSGVSISADALRECAERGIPVFYLDSRGHHYATLYTAGLVGTVVTRRAQILAYYDERGLSAALRMAEGKIHNQAATLKYMAKTRKDSDPDLYDELHRCASDVLASLSALDEVDAACVEEARTDVMAAEALAARRYWTAARLVLPDYYDWTGRVGRGATDPINSLLNYGYGILYGLTEQAILLAGLDPYAGFLHADRPGKPSLVLDLIEEFRASAVDRVVFGLANRSFIVEQDDAGRLSQETRRTLAERVLAHVEAGVRYNGKRFALRAVMQMQARELAAFLRGEREDYAAFKASW
ncbi:MAG: CRISPR-associated endonuclease Cas1 [Chloroflexi bacterium]|nr:CRISPR-associated endonuclease Cas1 [Chloroflexota bacterium]